MSYEIQFKITGLDEKSYNNIIEMLKSIKQAEIVNSSGPPVENWNPDWKGDPDDELRWKGW